MVQLTRLSVWKPLFGPLQDWPLTFCRPSSLNVSEDLELMDNVFPVNIEESIQLHYGEQQDWCYLSNQSDSEVIIFQGGDSKMGMNGGTSMLLKTLTRKRLILW